jgi:SAM-dependent methyltransferase
MAAARRVVRYPLLVSLWPLQRLPHNTIRCAMYQQLNQVAEQQGFRNGSSAKSGLSISGSGWLSDYLFPGSNITLADYPEVNCLNLPFDDNKFDFVVSDQVLEHIEGDPFQAIEESRRVLKPGGIAVHTTVFMFPVHGYPHDFWRFTPAALELLCAPFGQIVTSGAWGNQYVYFLNWAGVLFRENPPQAKWHPMNWIATRNESRFPIVTWVVARK